MLWMLNVTQAQILTCGHQPMELWEVIKPLLGRVYWKEVRAVGTYHEGDTGIPASSSLCCLAPGRWRFLLPALRPWGTSCLAPKLWGQATMDWHIRNLSQNMPFLHLSWSVTGRKANQYTSSPHLWCSLYSVFCQNPTCPLPAISVVPTSPGMFDSCLQSGHESPYPNWSTELRVAFSWHWHKCFLNDN
jgi:hypothetical protein